MKITSSITLPVSVFQRWRAYQSQHGNEKPLLSPLLAQLLDEYLLEQERELVHK